MQEKLAIIDSKRVGKQNTLAAKMQWMICTMLNFVISVSLDIWHIERYVCFWPLWFSKPTISCTVVMFSSVRVCFSLTVWCLWSVLHVSKIYVNNIPTLFAVAVHLQKVCQYFLKTVFLNRYNFFIRALSPLLNGTLHHRCIVSALKIIIYNNIACFCLQTSEMDVTLNIIKLLYENY